jgi:PAS domain S-box-containing protein
LNNLHQYIFESLDTYKDLFDNAHDLIHIAAPDGQLIYINNAWKRLLGYTKEEAHGASVYNFIMESDRDRFKKYREEILKGSSQNEITVQCRTKTGNTVWIEGFVSAKSEQETPVYTRGIFRDVTTRINNEAKLLSINKALTEREANLQQLLQRAPDAIIVIDMESTVTYWNPMAETIFGWLATEVLGKTLTNLIIPERYRQAHDNGMKRYLSTGEIRMMNRTVEITALRKNGVEFYIALTISTTRQNGQIAFIAFVRDINEQKKNILELNEKKAQLEKSNEELEQFAHVASHDMKEPLRKIRIFTNMLTSDSQQALPANYKDIIERIEKAASRLTAMVEGILAYSSVKSQELIMEDVNLNAIVKTIENDLELIIAEKEASIRYADLPVIRAAPFLLYQLFYNLINNSLKFTRPDIKPEIEVTSSSIADSTGQRFVTIVVSDNGIGFSQQHAENIFKTFIRLHPKDKYEGTGIGLSVCKSIVEKHKGLLAAYGEENAGARFVITLPA